MRNSKTMAIVLLVAGTALILVGGVDVARGQCEANELAKLIGSNPGAGEHMGCSVALEADTAVIGAYADDHAGGTNAGSAYVFVRSGDVWTDQEKLIAWDASAGDMFGFSVALDGDTTVIGASGDDHGGVENAGSAYVFVRLGATWTQQVKLSAPDAAWYDRFGKSVALDGDTAVVGAMYDDHAGGTNAGSAYVFVRSSGVWTFQAKLTASDATREDRFGWSVALDGDTAVIGAVEADQVGAAYVFVRSGALWTQQAKLPNPDAGAWEYFGNSVALDGDTAAIGAYHWGPGGAAGAGAAYVFLRSGGTWAQQAKLTALDAAVGDRFGVSVALDGDTAVIGADGDDHAGGANAGSAYVFVWWDGVWTQAAKLTASDASAPDSFGRSLGLSGDTAVTGAPEDEHSGDGNAGSAYVFHGLSDCQPNGTLDMCDIADGTSPDDNGNGIPDECEATVAYLDIKPGSCPNPLNVKSHGVLPTAIVGTADFDVTQIDVDSLVLSRADGVGGGVTPLMGPPGPGIHVEDVATPFEGEPCDCHDLAGDGIVDLSMKFDTRTVVSQFELNELPGSTLVELVLSGELLDETPFSARDCIRLVRSGPGSGALPGGLDVGE